MPRTPITPDETLRFRAVIRAIKDFALDDVALVRVTLHGQDHAAIVIRDTSDDTVTPIALLMTDSLFTQLTPEPPPDRPHHPDFSAWENEIGQ